LLSDHAVMTSSTTTTDTATIDDQIIERRIRGSSVRAIAQYLKIPSAQVHAAISRWSASFFSPDRRDGLALEVARLERMHERYYPAALSDNMKAAQLCCKLTGQRATLLGLFAPQQTIVSLEPTQPRQTSMDRIEAALNALTEQRNKKPDEPTAH